MSALSQVAALGLWPALPMTGYWLYARRRGQTVDAPYPSKDSESSVGAFSLQTAIGVAVWSLPLLLLAEAGVYNAAVVGLLGWLVTVAGAVLLWPRRDRLRTMRPSFTWWDGLLVAGLALTAVLYLGWPSENIIPEHDEGMYINQGIYVANHGSLHPPYPWPDTAESVFGVVGLRPPGAFKTGDSYTFYFGHLFQVWLAHAFATFGAAGIFRLNGVIALLSAGLFYALCRRLLTQPLAVIATLVLALNTSQLWLARNSLTEMITQAFIVAGLFLLLRALQDASLGDARWAGIFFGLSATVRVDSLLLVALLFGAHLAMRLVEAPGERSTRVWLALYTTALPAFALDLAYYALYSRPYFDEHLPLILPLCLVALAAAGVLLVGCTSVLDVARPWLTSRAAVVALGVLLLAMSVYAYFIRPSTTAPIFGASTHLVGRRSYAEDSLVNLAVYLSPLVVWVGILGWYVALWNVIRHRRAPYLLPIIVVVLSFALLYLYNPTITPLHYWAIRRFLPVVMPGWVLFAGIGAAWLGARMPVRPRMVASGIGALFLIGFIARSNALIYNFAEHKGQYEQMRALAAQLPEDEVVLALVGRRELRTWPTPLYLAFDRTVVPLNLSSEPGRRAFGAWVSTQAQSGKTSVPVIVRGGWRAEGISRKRIGQVALQRSYIEWTNTPPPKQIVVEKKVLRLYRVSVPD